MLKSSEPEVETCNGTFEFIFLLQTSVFEIAFLIPVPNQNTVLPIFANRVPNERLHLEDAFRVVGLPLDLGPIPLLAMELRSAFRTILRWLKEISPQLDPYFKAISLKRL